MDLKNIQDPGGTELPIQTSDVTGLDAALAGKAATSHSHSAADLTSGTVPDARFPATLPAASGANLTALNASNLGSGTVPDARFPATLPVASGANLTALNASNLGSGTIPDARFPAVLPAISGANLTNLPGASTNYVQLWHAGAVTYYSTIAAAQAAAASGDTLVCYGIFDEAGIGKNGVGYLFPPGSGITYTQATNTPIFHDNGSAITFTVDGAGTFIRTSAATSGSSGDIARLMNGSSTMYFEAARVDDQKFQNSLYAQSGAKFYIDIDQFTCTGPPVSLNQSSTIVGRIGTLVGTDRGLDIAGTGAGQTYLSIDKIQTAYHAIKMNQTGGSAFIQVKYISTTDNSIEAINVTNGKLYIDITGEVTSANSPCVQMDGGELHIEGRIKTTKTNGHAVVIAGGDCHLDAGCVLIANGTGKSVYAASAKNVYLDGLIVANADMDANITPLVGSLVSDSNVI